MNENVKIVFGLLGGLALFLYGMNGMSDALQKTAGDKMKKILSFLTKNPIMGALAGALDSCVAEQLRNNCYGNRICKCWTYESAAGNLCYLWCQYWYDNDSTVNGI